MTFGKWVVTSWEWLRSQGDHSTVRQRSIRKPQVGTETMNRNFSLPVALGIALTIVLSGCAKKAVPTSNVASISSSTSEEGLPAASPTKKSAEEKSREESFRKEPEPEPKPEKITPEEIGRTEVDVTTPQTDPSDLSNLVDIFFDFDRATLTEESKAILQRNARLILANNVKIQIEGHADERGTSEYNLTLGERRAQVVKRFLSAVGVNQNTIGTISYGEERPFCKRPDEVCYRQNRRAHFVIGIPK